MLRRITPIIGLLSLHFSLAAQFYVLSPDGDDRNPGTHDKPWATPARAARSLRPGDQLMIRDGTYAGPLTLAPPAAADAPGGRPAIRIFAHNPGKAVITAPAGGSALCLLRMQKVEITGLVLDGGGRGTWFDIRETASLLLRDLRLTAPGPGSSRWIKVNSAVVADCEIAGADNGTAPLWRCRDTGLVLWMRCSFAGGARPGVEFSGECRSNTFRFCGFSAAAPEMKAPPAGRLAFDRCAWRGGARPSADLWAHPGVLFRYCFFASGGFPGYDAIRACAIHNTALQTVPTGTPGPRCANNLFVTDPKRTFRPGKPPVERLRIDHPARDAGSGRLTVTTRNVLQSQILPVEDTGFFLGRGPSRLASGDMIWIGETHRPARVLAVDDARKQLTLDRIVDAEAGAAVAFPYHGAAPDLGWFEIGMDRFGRNAPGVPHGSGRTTFRQEWRFAPGFFTAPVPGN